MAEGYVGVKYELVPTGKGLTVAPLGMLEQLCKWGRIFDELKLAPPYEGGSYGNMGFRIWDESGLGYKVCVTPSRHGIGDLTIEDVMTIDDVVVSDNKVTVFFHGHPERKPTSEAQIYWELFKARPDIDVIMHGHDTAVVEVYTMLSDMYPFIGVVEGKYPYGTPEFAKAIVGAAGENRKYVIAVEHPGFFALGKTFEEAGKLAVEMNIKALKIING